VTVIVSDTPVAPHAGAWIETQNKARPISTVFVAPHAGAWIETAITNFFAIPDAMSPPMRGRGLKPA